MSAHFSRVHTSILVLLLAVKCMSSNMHNRVLLHVTISNTVQPPQELLLTLPSEEKTLQDHGRQLYLTIDNIDYVTGIGNSSREQYIRAGNPCRLDLQEKPQKCTKNHKKWPKIMHFSNTFENIYQTETLRSLKLGYPSGQGLL